MYIQLRKHTSDKNYIVKIIYIVFYKQQTPKYFSFIILNEILIT
jgi:hypothetical protein